MKPAILVVEPRTQGHHVGWLRFMVEDLLHGGHPVSLALDNRPEALQRVEAQLGDLLPQTRVLPLPMDRWKGRHKERVLAELLAQSGAALAFLADFSEIGSGMLRRAALGWLPPSSLRGRLGGIYFRPYFAARQGFSLQNWLKRQGARRLLARHWIGCWLFIDPFLLADAQVQFPGAPVFPLVDPYPENFHADREASRRALELPATARVFLFYGGGYRRKGLHLAVEAWSKLPTDRREVVLLCAGEPPREPQVRAGLAALEREGRAKLIPRYVSAEEERGLFAACDFVLLPYHGHRDSSGVLALAAGAGRPAVVSDEYIVGRTVREHGMGLWFPPGDVRALGESVLQAAQAGAEELARWQAGARACAAQCSRAIYRRQLLAAVASAGEPRLAATLTLPLSQ
jgi:glycosyltransferase involved in cell wall biosynthesis